MENNEKNMIPNWLWAVMAIAIVGLALALFMTDRRAEPGTALVYDISDLEREDQDEVRYAETRRIPLDLEQPSGLAVAGDGRILVTGDTALLELETSGTVLARHALPGAPHCVAVAPDGAVYLGMRDHVAPWYPDDSQAVPWENLGEKAWLTSLAADERYVYAADAGNARVLQYDRSGALLRVIGGYDTPDSAIRFILPSHYFDVVFDAMGGLWITNPGRLGIEKFREDGELLSAWHRPGMSVDAFAGCCNPIHTAFKSDGSLVTAEKGMNRVKVFAADRSFDGVAATHEHLSRGWKATNEPTEPAPVRDLAVDGDDRILVLHGPLQHPLIFERTEERN